MSPKMLYSSHDWVGRLLQAVGPVIETKQSPSHIEHKQQLYSRFKLSIRIT